MRLHSLGETEGFGSVVFGCMWKRGECGVHTKYVCRTPEGMNTGQEIPMQSRVTAYWPDGSVKWTAHAIDAAAAGKEIEVLPGTPGDFSGIEYEETEEEIRIQTGAASILIPKNGRRLFETVSGNGKVYLQDAEAVLLLEEPFLFQGNPAKQTKEYKSCIEKVCLEESGRQRAVIRYEGIHKSASGETKFPFVIRMEAYRHDAGLKFTHTFLYDGDENRDFLKGLGIRFFAPMSGELYNRHVKFTADHGTFHEALVPLTAWRPRIPLSLYRRQMAGERLVLSGTEKELVSRILQDVPVWSQYILCQDSVSHFGIKKKLRGEGLCHIDSLHGNRSAGGCAFGSEHGSITAAVRDFWEKYPSGITLNELEGERAECTLWFWSPETAAMDFRHYARRGYNQVCYEGYDYNGATPVGIACTNECAITFSAEMIPADGKLEAFARAVNRPAVYVGTPEFYHEMRAFGYWSLPAAQKESGCEDGGTEEWLERQLELAFAFYRKEVEQRNWYGMFDYGDVMHTYDPVRHQWKYDMGGYAWDNTELVPTLWLWLYFLRTGREDVFRMAEKLSRHAADVDVYHMGRYKGLGSRHNVRHWGCPCKETRIAMAGHHRYLYYLTGDRRLEDIFDEWKENELSFLNKDPLGDFYNREDMVYPSHARSGPDWAALCSNWMTQWERFHDRKFLEKIKTGIRDIASAPLKLVSGPDFEFDPVTCHLRYIGERNTGGSHLQICMGAPQVWTELGELMEDEAWNEMLADLGEVYFMTKEERDAATGGLTGDREFTFPYMAAGIGAYAAAYRKDGKLAKRVWKALLEALLQEENGEGFACVLSRDQGNQKELREIPWISTNFAAQFCLNAIMALEFIREYLPRS